MSNSHSGEDFEAFLGHLKESRGFDFTAYKRATLQRRVQRRMAQVGVQDYGEYLDYIQVHPEEFEPLFNSILINVTSFFRDPEAWAFVASVLIPRLADLRTPSGEPRPIRIWSAGCSSGEEAYTIAMLMTEALGEAAFKERVKIYATDIDEEALTAARRGSYTDQQVKDIPEELRERYFEHAGSEYSFKKELRRSIIFGRHDLIQDAPISRIDLLITRNTLMYMNADAQTRVLSRLHYALNGGGFIFLGKAETLIARSPNFEPVESKQRIFAKVMTAGVAGERAPEGWEPMKPVEEETAAPAQSLRELSFSSSPVAQIILDANIRLVSANEAALDLFALARSDIGRAFSELDISFRPIELRSHVSDALKLGVPFNLQSIPFPGRNDAGRWYDVQVAPLIDSGGQGIGARITFIDVTMARLLTEELERVQSDLETTNEELQSSNEELETTNEELQSTVEELETTNEELQSTNEELETLNEELHSTNEELEAANDMLREQSAELDQAAAFVESVLTSMKAAMIVLDPGLLVLTWSQRAEDLWGVRPNEARGVHFSNLDIGLPVDRLLQPIRDCLNGRLELFELTVQATNRRGRSFDCRITLNTLKDKEQTARGVVLLMEEERTPDS